MHMHMYMHMYMVGAAAVGGSHRAQVLMTALTPCADPVPCEAGSTYPHARTRCRVWPQVIQLLWNSTHYIYIYIYIYLYR